MKALSRILWKENKQEIWKIALLGGRYVGKSSLMHRDFSRTGSVYGQTASLNKENFVVDSKMCTVEIMDVPYPWEAVSPLYGRESDIVRNCDGIILVYSLDWSPAYEEPMYDIKKEYERALMLARVWKRTDPIVFMVVGSKSDIACSRSDWDSWEWEGQGQPPGDWMSGSIVEMGKALANEWGCEFIETSSKMNTNVDEAVRMMVRSLRVAKYGKTRKDVKT